MFGNSWHKHYGDDNVVAAPSPRPPPPPRSPQLFLFDFDILRVVSSSQSGGNYGEIIIEK